MSKYFSAGMVLAVSFALVQAAQDIRLYLPGRDGGFMGVRVRDLSGEETARLPSGTASGIYVEEVEPEGPSAKAGVKVADVVTHYAGYSILGARHFQRLVGETPSGRRVELQVIRAGQTLRLTAVTGEREGVSSNFWQDREWEGGRARAESFAFPMPEPHPDIRILPRDGQRRFHFFSDRPRLGISGGDITEQLADFLGVPGKKGILIMEVQPNTPAQRAGLKAGDVVVAVDGRAVETLHDLTRRLQGSSHELEIIRDRQSMKISVSLDSNQPQTPRIRL